MTKIIESIEFLICLVLIGGVAFVVVGFSALIVPVRWLLEDRRRLKAEGDKCNS